jgi:DNA polymerase family A
MSPWINTHELEPDSLRGSENMQVYCGLDSMVTKEVLGELRTLFNAPPQIYNFERALQAPYLEIMQRGWLIDEVGRRAAVDSLMKRLHGDGNGRIGLYQTFWSFTQAICDKNVNPRSPDQLKDLFYSRMRLPEQWISQKGQRKLSTNREALEKLEVYMYARPLVACILTIREIEKQLEVLETEVDRDQRMRCSYNIAGTETGRASSSESVWGTGSNLQNIAPILRFAFVADPGMKLAQIDLEQVEARDVGFIEGCLFDDWTFLDSCESGDLHTNNSKIIWPELPWTGDPSADRKIAERQFYREFSYRDMSKRGGHLSNYSGTAWTASRHLKVPMQIMEEFQARYCRGRALGPKGPAIEPAFPAHPRYWQWCAEQIQTHGFLTTPFGRRRHFFGRLDQGETLREAIAFLPQSTTADRTNLGLWRVWKYLGSRVQVLGQCHDSIAFQYDEKADEQELIGRALELIRIELRAPNGRSYVVPGEAKVGWNWGQQVTQKDIADSISKGKKPWRFNPDGLVKFKPGKRDERVRAIGLKRLSGA